MTEWDAPHGGNPEWIPGWSGRRSFRRRPGYHHRWRLAASVLLVVGSATAGISAFLPWWSERATGGPPGSGITSTTYFPMGYALFCSQSGGSAFCGILNEPPYEPTVPNASWGGWSSWNNPSGPGTPLSHPGNVFATVLGSLVAALVLGLFAVLLGLLGGFGLNFGRWQFLLTVLGAVLAAGLLFAVAGLVSVDLGPRPSPPWELWGSSTTEPPACDRTCFDGGQANWSWAPALGWYSSLVGGGLLLSGAWVYARTRRAPYTAEEIRRTEGAA